MARNINKVVLTGNLTRDPEMIETDAGLLIASLRIAVNGSRKKDDEWVEQTEFVTVKAFGGTAEAIDTYLEKGRAVAVDGRLSWSEWVEKDTEKRREKLEVIADNIQFLGPMTPRQSPDPDNQDDPWDEDYDGDDDEPPVKVGDEPGFN